VQILCKAVQNRRAYLPFAFAALNSAHRSLVAFEIFALAAADITRFFPPVRLPVDFTILDLQGRATIGAYYLDE
jgi:hypothetical protein